jgi:hypothetical protein
MIQFIDKIRASDQRTKLKWLIILSSISMVLVVIVWIIAINVITSTITNPEPPKTPSDQTTVSFMEQLSALFTELRDRTTNAFSIIKSNIGSRTIELEQPATNPQ